MTKKDIFDEAGSLTRFGFWLIAKTPDNERADLEAIGDGKPPLNAAHHAEVRKEKNSSPWVAG